MFICQIQGETDADGPEFLGCNWNGTDTVEGAKFRPPSVCGLPKERGSTPDGGNHTVRWYYDMEYGGCARYENYTLFIIDRTPTKMKFCSI